MFEKLSAILAEIMNVDLSDITPETPLRAADGLDDLDFARLVLACEKRFHTTIYDVDAAAFWHVEDLRAYLAEKIQNEEGGQGEDAHSPIDTDEYFYSE